MEKVDRAGDCWLWTAKLSHNGYGAFWNKGREVRAHRWSYERFVGPIPAGLQIDHLCKKPACVNPAHLEAVTGRENLMRGDTFQAKNAKKTHCVNGHAFDEKNTYWRPTGGRSCWTCMYANTARYVAAKKAAKKADAA